LKIVAWTLGVGLAILAVCLPPAGDAEQPPPGNISEIKAHFVPGEFATHYTFDLTGFGSAIQVVWGLDLKCVDPGCPDSSGTLAAPKPNVDSGCNNNGVGTPVYYIQDLTSGQTPEFVWHHPSTSDDPTGKYHCDHAKEGPRGHQGQISVSASDGRTLCIAAFKGTNSSTPTSVADGTASTPECHSLCHVSVAAPFTRAIKGFDYAVSFIVYGGKPPYTFSLKPGTSLPPGLHMDSSGKLTGTPTTAGDYPISVRAVDSVGCEGDLDYTFRVATPADVEWSAVINYYGGTGQVGAFCPPVEHPDACIFFQSIQSPSATKGKAKGAASPSTIGTVRGTVPAGKTRHISVRLTKAGLRLLRRKHPLSTTVIGTRTQGTSIEPVLGHLKLRLSKR
jgi:hypothetical protein